MNTRRHFLGAAAALVAAGAASRNALAAAPEPHQYNSAETAAPLHPQAGRPYNPVVTLNGWSLPFRMKDGVKEFHLVAEPVVREISPGMTAKLEYLHMDFGTYSGFSANNEPFSFDNRVDLIRAGLNFAF